MLGGIISGLWKHFDRNIKLKVAQDELHPKSFYEQKRNTLMGLKNSMQNSDVKMVLMEQNHSWKDPV
jgi:hypothetical protein